ncbi:MAG: tetratricopeptide repeat protein [Bacteroidota bacterium]
MKKIILCVFLIMPWFSFAQTKVDSLERALDKAKSDTNKVNLLNELSRALWGTGSYDRSLEYSGEALVLGKKLGFVKGTGQALNNQGIVYRHRGDYDKALENYFSALDIYEKHIETFSPGEEPFWVVKGKAVLLNNLGLIYWNKGDYAKALEYYTRSMKIDEEIGDRNGEAICHLNMGIIHDDQGNYDKALENYFMALRIFEDIPNKKGIAVSRNNIGLIYMNRKNYDKALDNFRYSLVIRKDIGDKNGMASSYNNIGIIFEKQEKYDLAIENYFEAVKIMKESGDSRGLASCYNNVASIYAKHVFSGDPTLISGFISGIKNLKGFNDVNDTSKSTLTLHEEALRYQWEALAIQEEIDDKRGMTYSLNGMGKIYNWLGDAEKAIQSHLRSSEIAEGIGAKRELQNAYGGLAEAYSTANDHTKAYRYIQMSSDLKDTLFNEEKSKEIGKLEAGYEMEKKLAEEMAEAETKVKAEAEKQNRKNLLQYSGIFIFIVMLFVGVFMLGKYTIPIRFAEGIIFFTFLLFFEFTLVLLDPYIELYSSGAPAIKLAFNAVLAALIFPLHSFFEGTLKSKILKQKREEHKTRLTRIITVIILLSVQSLINPFNVYSEPDTTAGTGLHTGKIDSLINLLASEETGTAKVKILNSLAQEYYLTDLDSAMDYHQKALDLASDINYRDGMAVSYHGVGLVHYYNSNFEKAIIGWQEQYDIEKELGNTKGMSTCVNNIGVLYGFLGDYNKALEYYFINLRMQEEMTGSDDPEIVLTGKKNLADNYNNIGLIFSKQGIYDKSLEFYLKSLKIAEEINELSDTPENKMKIAVSFINIGINYKDQGYLKTAMSYYFKAKELYENLIEDLADNVEWIEAKKGLAGVFNNIGAVNHTWNERNTALEYYLMSIKTDKEIGNKQGMAQSYNNIGDVYLDMMQETQDSANIYDLSSKVFEYHKAALDLQNEIGDQYGFTYSLFGMGLALSAQGKLMKSRSYLERAYLIADSIEAKSRAMELSRFLAENYASTGDHKMAFEFFRKHSSLKDSLFNEEKSKEIGKLEARYEMEKKMAEEKAEAEVIAKAEAELMARRNNLQYSGILIFIVLLFVGMFMLGKINIPIRFAEGIIFFTFLLFFEFTLVLLDPYIELHSSGAPAIKLAFNAVLAALIFPLHSFFEEMLKKRIMKKTKKQ